MVADHGDKLDSAGLVEGLDTKVIVLVEVRVLEGLEVAVGVHLLEPLRLLGVNHGVLGEHHEHGAVEGGEALLSGGSGISGLSQLFVVKVG